MRVVALSSGKGVWGVCQSWWSFWSEGSSDTWTCQFQAKGN